MARFKFGLKSLWSEEIASSGIFRLERWLILPWTIYDVGTTAKHL